MAAFMVEPIQGKGVYMASDRLLGCSPGRCAAVTSTLSWHDEVQTGMGRTGRFFCHEHWGVEPDIITCPRPCRVGTSPSVPCCARVEVLRQPSTARWTGPWSTPRPSRRTSWPWSRVWPRCSHRRRGDRGAGRRRTVTDDGGVWPLVEKYELLHEVRGMGLMIGLTFGRAGVARRRGPGSSMMELARKGLFSQTGRGAAVPPAPHPDPGGGGQRQHHQAAPAAEHRRRGDRRLRRRASTTSWPTPPQLGAAGGGGDDHGQQQLASGPRGRGLPRPPPGPGLMAAGPGGTCRAGSGRPGTGHRRRRVHRLGAGAGAVWAGRPRGGHGRAGGDAANLEGLDVEKVEGDLRDAEAVDQGGRRGRLASTWLPSTGSGPRTRTDFYDINVTGTRHVLEPAPRQAGCERLVYTSRWARSGSTGRRWGDPVDETSYRPYRPSLRRVQAVQVRGRARGAAGGGRGPARGHRAADHAGGAPRPRSDADRPHRARVPQRAVPRVRRHHPQHRGRRRRGPRPRAGRRAGRQRPQLHPRRRELAVEGGAGPRWPV